MQVAVTGASGLIGTVLVRRLEAEGHRVLRLTRSRPTGPDQAHWDPAAGELDPEVLAKAEMLLVSQRARPARLQETGYRFQFPELEPALRHTLGRGSG
jgi:NAD dependent epimerase/dehydratase family enzyme